MGINLMKAMAPRKRGFWIQIGCLMAGVSLAYAQQNAIGNPGPENNWNTVDTITALSSSQHLTQAAANLVNGKGMDESGLAIGNGSLFISGNLSESKANPRGGTVAGGHWVEFEFDDVYPLGEMWIWNYNGRAVESDWRNLGFRNVTIQYSENGGADPADWTVAFEGEIPVAVSGNPDFLAQVSQMVDFHGARARYVVITTADSPDHNWIGEGSDLGETATQAGLGAVRFFIADKPSDPKVAPR